MRLSKKEAAIRLGKSERTLQRYNLSKILEPAGRINGRPYYTEKQLKKFVLRHGKNKSVKVIWLSKIHCSKEQRGQNKLENTIYLFDDPVKAFDVENRNFNYVVDLLIKYKIKDLKIGSVLMLTNRDKFNVLQLFSKKFGIDIEIIDEYEKEENKNV